jgi:hypothetical protein
LIHVLVFPSRTGIAAAKAKRTGLALAFTVIEDRRPEMLRVRREMTEGKHGYIGREIAELDPASWSGNKKRRIGGGISGAESNGKDL